MRRPIHLLIQVAGAAAAGWLSAYVFLSAHSGAPRGAFSTAVALLPAAGRAVSSLPQGTDPVSHSAEAQYSMAIASYRDAVASAGPSVVTVHSIHASKGPLPLSPAVLAKGLGSGVIVGGDGYIVTNNHVIDGASQVAVALPDGALQAARLIGSDLESDIALLKVEAEDLRAITPVNINGVAVGDVVLAVGNPLGVGQTVTQGIVSAIVRKGTSPVENFIQTDAAVNPGNSGGALIDTAGRLVGINVAILSHSGGSEGIGFAIPVDYVQAVTSALKASGRVARAWLGVTTGPSPTGSGALVVAVEREGPADRGGVTAGDIIARIGEKPVSHPQDARSVVIGAEPGAHLPIEILRNGKRLIVDVTLAAIPPRPAR